MADYLKIPEVARRLDVSEPTVRRMVKSGKLPSVFIGGAYRVSEKDLEEYLESAKVTPGKAPAPPSQQPSFENHLREERRQQWDAAVRNAREVREYGRARMEELLSAWRDKRDRRALRGMGRLLQAAYDAETALAHYLKDEGTGRIRLDRIPVAAWEEVREASRFYGALRATVEAADLDVYTEDEVHKVKDAA